MNDDFDPKDSPFYEESVVKEHSTVTEAKKGTPPFLKNKKKLIVRCGENILIAVRWLFPTNFRYNEWTHRRETNIITGRWHNLEDSDYMYVRSEIANKFTDDAIRTASLPNVIDAVQQHCHQNATDPALNYFLDITGTWDKTPRLDTWLMSTYNVPDTAYYRAVSSNFLKGMVKRVFQPGCKFDTVLVLEGPQGIGKSTSLEVLGGNWHTSITASPDNKDFFLALQGHMIVEFSEGETLSRAEVKQLKSVISTRIDSFRPPYGHETRDYPRRCVFAMSTNQTEYLKDETGNRRWLPVACEGTVNLEWLRINRDQLFAEAVERAIANEETVHEFPLEETLEMQEARLIDDPDREKVIDWYFFNTTEEQRSNGISTQDAFTALQPSLGYMKLEKMDRLSQMRLGSLLRNSLHLEVRQVASGNVRVRRYFPSARTLAMAPTPSPTDVLFNSF